MPDKYTEDKETRLARWLSGELSEKEKSEWEPEEDFEDLDKILAETDKLSIPKFDINQNLAKIKERTQNQHEKPTKIRRIRFIRLAVAASLLLLVGFFLFNPLSNPIRSFETLAGGQEMITLPDGSTVSLNHVSQLSYNEKEWSDNREIQLKGEAFFQVEKGSSFTVRTDNGTVRVLGTSFNVFSRNKDFNVECHTGKVEVKSGAEKVQLIPGSKVVLSGEQLITQTFSPSGSSDWEKGLSQFNSAPLRLVMKEMEYRFGASVNMESVDAESPFTGTFLHKDFETALKMVCEPMNLDYTIQGKSVTLREKN